MCDVEVGNASGRNSFWTNPSVPIQFHFFGSRSQRINRENGSRSGCRSRPAPTGSASLRNGLSGPSPRCRPSTRGTSLRSAHVLRRWTTNLSGVKGEAMSKKSAAQVVRQAHAEGAVRGRVGASADRARRDAAVGGLDRRARAGALRGSGCRGQGRRDQAGDAVPQPAARARRRAAEAVEEGARPVVLPALHRAPARQGRDRADGPVLVQPRRRRARHGLLHRGGVPDLPPPDPDRRAPPHRGRDHPDQVLVLGLRRRAAGPVRLAARGSDASLEAVADRPRVDPAVGGLLPREGRHVRRHRHRRSRRGGPSKATTSAAPA